MPASGVYGYSVTRDQIIARALRICSAIGQGETPSTTAITEASQTLNDLMKEWEADGMQLWKVSSCTPIALTANKGIYSIGPSGADVSQTAPLKIFQMWMRNTSTLADSPGNIWTKNEYDRFASKSTTGSPTILYYSPPGVPTASGQVGNIYLLPVPDANAAASQQLVFTGLYPLSDFTVGTDNPDLPSYYYNSLVWNLAGQLSYEYSVPLSERAMIDKKAAFHKEIAEGFDVEEGSLYLMPQWEFGEG